MIVANKPRRPFKHIFIGLLAALSSLSISLPARAQYLVLDYVSDIKGAPPKQPAIWKDTNLVNPWGIAFSPQGPIWVSNAGTGTSTLYNGRILGLPVPSLKQPLVVTVPSGVASAPGSQGVPTGIVFNGTSNFVVYQGTAFGPALFIFATGDGTISGWSPGVSLFSAILAVDNSLSGAAYTGLDQGSNSAGNNFLYAANPGHGTIDVFDGSFAPATLAGSFTDPSLPTGFVPFSVHNIGGMLYVTYTSFSSDGLVDIFDTDGNFIQRLVSPGSLGGTSATLNLPWGLALAPANFGTFSNDLLVGNLGDGYINAFDPSTGAFLGRLSDRNGNTIVIDHLWGLAFGNGVLAGRTNDLLFTAGIQNETHGLLGAIRALTP
jgi:uncharacterized protein (TIGR03118 family)